MPNKIQFKRGLKASLPDLDAGEPGYCTDTQELYIGNSAGPNTLIASSAETVKNWLKGKVINFIGDSILIVGTKPYPQLVGEILNCTTNNYGISGDRLSGAGGINERVLNMDTNATVNVISGGTNDWTWNVPLGIISDVTNATVYGALNVMATNLIATYPNAINVLMTPLKRSKLADAGAVDYTLQAVAKAMADIAKRYNFILFDLYDDMPNFNPNIPALKDRWAPDGLHPNDAYIDKYYAPKVALSLLSLQSSSKVGGVEAGTPTWTGGLFTPTGFTLEKDDNNVVTFGLLGSLNAGGAGSHIIGNIPKSFRPRIVTILSAITYNPLSPVSAWVSDVGDIVVLTDKAWTGTLYCNVTFRTIS